MLGTKPSIEQTLKNILLFLISAPVLFQKGFEVTLVKSKVKKWEK